MIWIPGVGEKWACGATEIERDKVDLFYADEWLKKFDWDQRWLQLVWVCVRETVCARERRQTTGL
jgi:hypothetical protein